MKLFTILVLAAVLAASATAAPKQKPKVQAVKITNGPRVEGTGPTWAVIAWTTNTGGSSVIHYGTDANNLGQTAKSPYADNDKTKAQNHRVHLKNLKPNTNISSRWIRARVKEPAPKPRAAWLSSRPRVINSRAIPKPGPANHKS